MLVIVGDNRRPMYPAVEGAQHPQVYPSRFEDREPLESRNERTRWRGGPGARWKEWRVWRRRRKREKKRGKEEFVDGAGNGPF